MKDLFQGIEEELATMDRQERDNAIYWIREQLTRLEQEDESYAAFLERQKNINFGDDK